MIDLHARLAAGYRPASGSHNARLGRFLIIVVVLATLLCSGMAEPVSASTPAPGAAAVIAAARHHLGAAYRSGATGPRAFDCSGLVYRAFKEARRAGIIGGTRASAAAYMRMFERRGQASRTHGRPGDLVIYGHGSHIGIYLGRGMVISALTSGVRRHGLKQLTVPFTEFLHTHLAAAH